MIKKIAISGVHCQGKTTLINDLLATSYFAKEWSVFSSPSRAIALTQGVDKINERGDGYVQLSIMHQHLTNIHNAHRSSIFDRSALDGFAYSMSLRNNITAEYYELIKKYFYITMPQYDLLVYIEPELELQRDGVRSVNKEFFDNTVNSFNTIFKEYGNLLPTAVIRVHGDRDNRVRMITDYIHSQQQ